jgi:Ca2+-binding EF-hand superfamily protein
MRGFGEDFFVGILKTQYKLESELETMKEKLITNCQDFNAVIGFRLFRPSADRTEKLGLKNLKAAFSSVGVAITDDQAKLLVKRFDNDRDGMLTYTDICDIFMPRDPHLQQEFKRRLPFDHKRSG